MISVITVALNSENTIEKTITSVISQEGADFEYIIIDGGSTDNTINIIRKYEERITWWISEKDKGIYDAMNKGLDKAKGDIIGFINSDDWYEKDALRSASELLKDTSADILSGGLWECNQNGEVIKKRLYPCENPWEGMAWGHPAIFAKKKVYDIIGRFDSTYTISGDYKWLLTCYAQGIRFKYTDKVLAYFRHGGVSDTYDIKKAEECYRAVVDVGVNRHNNNLIIAKAQKTLKQMYASYYIDESKYAKMLVSLIPNVSSGVYLYGYGKYGSKIRNILSENQVIILGIADKTDKAGIDFKCTELSELVRKTDKTIVVCVLKPDNSIINIEKRFDNVICINNLLSEIGEQILEFKGVV